MPFIDASLALPDGRTPLQEVSGDRIQDLLGLVPDQSEITRLALDQTGAPPWNKFALQLDDAASVVDRRIILRLGETAGIVSPSKDLGALTGYLFHSLHLRDSLVQRLFAAASGVGEVLDVIRGVWEPLIDILQQTWSNFAAIGSVIPYVREVVTLLQAPMRLIRWFRAQITSGGPPPDLARIVPALGFEQQQQLDRRWIQGVLDIVDKPFPLSKPLRDLTPNQLDIVTDWTRLVLPRMAVYDRPSFVPPINGRAVWWERFQADFGDGQKGHAWRAMTDSDALYGEGIVPGLPWMYGAWQIQASGNRSPLEPISSFMPVSRRVAMSLWSRVSSGSPESLRINTTLALDAWRSYWERLRNQSVLDAGLGSGYPEQNGPRMLIRSELGSFTISNMPPLQSRGLQATDGSGLWVTWYGGQDGGVWSYNESTSQFSLASADDGGSPWIIDAIEYLRRRAGIIEARARDDAAQGELLGRVEDGVFAQGERRVSLYPWYIIEDALLALRSSQRFVTARSIAAAYASRNFSALRSYDGIVRSEWEKTRRAILENDTAVRQVEWDLIPDAQYRDEVRRRQFMPIGGVQLAAAPVKPGKPPAPNAAVFELGAAVIDPPFPPPDREPDSVEPPAMPSGGGVGGAPGSGASEPGADTSVAVRPAASRSTTPSWLLPVGLLAAGAGAAYVYRRKLSG